MSASDRLRHVLRKCEIDHAPDPRVTVFDVSAERGGDAIVLSGTVLTDHLKTRAVAAVEAVSDLPVAASDVTVLERSARSRTVTAPIAPVRGDPDEDGEQVTQVLYGASLTAYDCGGDGDGNDDSDSDTDGNDDSDDDSDNNSEWRRVRTPDGYVGWVECAHLRTVEEIDADGVVATGAVDAEADPGTVYAGTECEIVGPEKCSTDAVRVRFRTGVEHALPADAVGEVPETTAGEDVVETAREYLGTEYVWGGMTVEGIDCSGLTWMSYRRNGVTLPRDADLQRRTGEEVGRDEAPRDELEPGDLLFFPGHVAMSLGGAEFVHASGSAEEVVEESLDPGHDRYNEELDESFELATRLL